MNSEASHQSPRGSACRLQIRIGIHCCETDRASRYAQALHAAGYELATPLPTRIHASSAEDSAPAMDLLICDATSRQELDDPLHWQSLERQHQPSLGTILNVAAEPPPWVAACIRNGALHCHRSSDEDSALVAIVDECLGLQADFPPAARVRSHESSMTQRLANAIASESIDVQFQPIISCADATCSRVEALARWNDTILGPVPPTRFIAVAETLGLIDDLDRLILRKSIAALSRVRARGHLLNYSINLSRRQFSNPNLVEDYVRIVQDAGEEPSHITLEITETAKFESETLAMSLMREFIDAGFNLAVDDFGSGESPFVQMSQIGYHELKIDRALVSCIATPAGHSILRSIIGMAQELNMCLVAEGVEDQRTADLLRALKADYCQGYHFARPMPLQELIDFLDNNNNGCGPATVPIFPFSLS